MCPDFLFLLFYLEFIFHSCSYLVKLLQSKTIYTFSFSSNGEVVIVNQPASCKGKIEYSIKIVFSINFSAILDSKSDAAERLRNHKTVCFDYIYNRRNCKNDLQFDFIYLYRSVTLLCFFF